MESSKGTYRKIRVSPEEINEAVKTWIEDNHEDRVCFPEDYKVERIGTAGTKGLEFTLYYENPKTSK